MEIIKSRYGLDRTIEKLNYNTMRVMGESQFFKTSKNNSGETTVFDFEGGPYLSIGSKINFGGIQWKINKIDDSVPMYKGLSGCHISVEPLY
jgi:hypothetical protein